MNLDDAAIADEAHDRQRRLCSTAHHHLDAGRVEPPGEVVADRVQGPAPSDIELAQHAGELMRVRELRPAVAQLCRIDCGIDCIVGCGRAGIGDEVLRLVVQAKIFDHLIIGGKVRLGTQMNLVDGMTPLVEELQAAANFPFRIRLGHGETMCPGAGKDAQVDFGAKHQSRGVSLLDVLVDADLFVDGAFVAGKRKDFAQLLDALEEAAGAAFDPDGGEAAFGSDERCLRNAELRGDVTFAQLRILGAIGPDFGRVGRMLSVIVISLLVQNQLALAGDLHPVDHPVVGNGISLWPRKRSWLSTIGCGRFSGATVCGDRGLSLSFGVTVLPIRELETRRARIHWSRPFHLVS